ncbi:MAG: low molecular weight phosphatase family protein, partial [Alphaproteobacteria bacterium]|nr:low molecular weight phosphatase family protein [Alphaproteobacteria bacterium]
MSGLPGAVLFCCSMNAVRSPMAESMLRMFHGGRIYVQSVGARCGEPDGFTVAVMEELGVDLSRHIPRDFGALEDDAFDLIIALSPEAQHHALEMTRTAAIDVEYWNTFDPTWV